MRVLLDEMLDRRLKQWLPEGIETVTVRERGWDSKKNGELLALAEKAFYILLTTDQGIPHQQDLSQFDLEVVVLSARSNRLADLEPRMEGVRRLIEELDQRYIHVTTQKTFVALDEHGSGSRPDLIVEVHYTVGDAELESSADVVML